MGSLERRERGRQELRRRILDAARDIFVASGYEAVTMRGIAERIEYSPAALYFHFRDKESLVRELIKNDIATLLEGLRRLCGIQDPIERIREHGRIYLGFAQTNPSHYRLLFMTDLSPAAQVQEPPAEGDVAIDGYAMLRSAVEAAIKSKTMRSDLTDPDLVVQTLWAGWHGVAALQLSRTHVREIPMRSFEEMERLMIDTLIDGLCARPTPRSERKSASILAAIA
jgi:AcrR family transcriptional regulator